MTSKRPTRTRSTKKSILDVLSGRVICHCLSWLKVADLCRWNECASICKSQTLQLLDSDSFSLPIAAGDLPFEARYDAHLLYNNLGCKKVRDFGSRHSRDFEKAALQLWPASLQRVYMRYFDLESLARLHRLTFLEISECRDLFLPVALPLLTELRVSLFDKSISQAFPRLNESTKIHKLWVQKCGGGSVDLPSLTTLEVLDLHYSQTRVEDGIKHTRLCASDFPRLQHLSIELDPCYGDRTVEKETTIGDATLLQQLISLRLFGFYRERRSCIWDRFFDSQRVLPHVEAVWLGVPMHVPSSLRMPRIKIFYKSAEVTGIALHPEVDWQTKQVLSKTEFWPPQDLLPLLLGTRAEIAPLLVLEQQEGRGGYYVCDACGCVNSHSVTGVCPGECGCCDCVLWCAACDRAVIACRCV